MVQSGNICSPSYRLKRKMNGTMRFCVDFGKIKSFIVKANYPLMAKSRDLLLLLAFSLTLALQKGC